MDDLIKSKLQFLAAKYENKNFLKEDPSQFLYWYPMNQIIDIECAAFIAAMLSFGQRKQFIPKISNILTIADNTSGTISKWLCSGSKGFPRGATKYYRFYSFDDMHDLFEELSIIIANNGDRPCCSFGEYLKKKYEKNRNMYLSDLISQSFTKSKIVSKGCNTANKRVNMFLRWMVRKNSSVDLGLWSWYSENDLIIPLDVHVLEESIKLGLIEKKSKATRKTALLLTEKLKEIFPSDPCKADYALFGLGINRNE